MPKQAVLHALVLDSLEEQIAVINPEGTIVYVNLAWEEFGGPKGLSPEHGWTGVSY